MTDTINRVAIKLTADSSEVVASVEKAKSSIKSLGAANEAAGGKSAQSIAKYVKSLELAAASAGNTSTELKLMKLAQDGASDSQLKAAAAALLNLDAQKKLNSELRRAQESERNKTESKDNDKTRFLAQLKEESETYGMTRNQLREYRAAQLGVSKEASGYISSLKKMSGETKELGSRQKLTAMQATQLAYQLNDFGVQVASGQSPLIALIQQGSQLNGTFGGVRGTISALATVFTPLRIAIGGTAAALGTLAYAYLQGEQQSKAFNNAILLSGNYAGQTAGGIDRLAKSVADSTNTSVGSVREFANALISTGEIGPKVFDQATAAAVQYAEATGKTAKDVAADFAKMANDPLKSAKELNKSWNLLTAAELEYIETMQNGGQKVEAQILILSKMQERLSGLEKNLGTAEKVGREFSKMLSDMKDGFYAIGRDRTLEDRIKDLQGILDRTDFSGFLGKLNSALGMSPERIQNFYAKGDAKGELARLQEEKRLKDEKAAADALKAEREKRDTEASDVIDPLAKKAKGSYKKVEDNPEFQKAEAKLQAAFKAKADNGRAIDPKEQKILLDQLKKDFAPPKGSTAGASEAGQVLKANLDSDLKAIKDALDAEKETLAFHQRYVQGVYAAGQISLKDFYDDKRATIAAGVTAEVAELDKEIARLEQYKNATKDPSEKIATQTKINEVGAQKEKLGTAASREIQLANQEEAASFRALSNQVLDYRANLLQLQGDELGAAKIRAQVAIQNAQILAAQGAKDAQGNPVEIDVAGYAKRLEIANQFADVQRKSSELAQNTSRAEEAANLRSEMSGQSLLDTERAIYGIRKQEVEQLGVLTARAKELADASTDPRIKAYAADLALAYAKAADAIDPALNRLRGAQKELASGITSTIDNGIANFGPNYTNQRRYAQQELKDEKDKYDRKIDILEGYLSETRDKNDKARLREKIANLQAQRDGVKGESKTGSVLKTIETSIIQPMAGQALATVNKLLVTDPLQKYLEGQFRSLTEGDGMLAGFFKDALKIQDPKVMAQTAEIASINASASALDVLAAAANNAAGAIGSRPLEVTSGSKQVLPSMGDFTRADRALGDGSVEADPATAQATADARQAVEGFGSSALSAANDVAKMAAAAGKGGGALSILPSIISSISAAMSAMTASSAGSSSGNLLASLGSLFSSGGGAASAGDAITSFYFHTGGVVGGPARAGSVPSTIFANAPRYHTGGLVGKKADALKAGEVPAILMKNEEVLREDDPRHRGNLGAELFKQIMAGAKPWNQTVADGAKEAKPEGESLSGLLRTIAGGKGDGENSAEVLGGLLSRLGVKEGGKALKVAGGRAIGGPVSAGGLYEVNEKGRPELLQVAGKEYLMMGSQGGKVEANPQMGGGGAVYNLAVHVTPPPGSNAATANQWGAMAGRQMQTALRRNG